MKNNIPEYIYLQTGTDDYQDFQELHRDCITWCEDKIEDSDIKYVSVDCLSFSLAAKIKAIEEEIKLTQEMMVGTMGGGQRLHRLRGQKKLLKQLIDEL